MSSGSNVGFTPSDSGLDYFRLAGGLGIETKLVGFNPVRCVPTIRLRRSLQSRKQFYAAVARVQLKRRERFRDRLLMLRKKIDARVCYCGKVKGDVCPFRFSMVNPSEFVTTLTC
jgi:hypothetical protein